MAQIAARTASRFSRHLGALQRQEPGLVSQEGVRRGRLQGPDHLGRAEALEDQIVADGDTPWCIGIESGAATGWPATDWMEDIMLRTTSPENYDKWVTGELKFDSPEVKNAAEIMSKRSGSTTDGRTADVEAIVSTSFGDAPGADVHRTRPSAGCTARATSSPPSSRRSEVWRRLRLLLPPGHRRAVRQAVPGGRRHLRHVQGPPGSARASWSTSRPASR